MTTWRDKAFAAIQAAHAAMPDAVSLAERKKAIDAAYPFGERRNHPYKAWLTERSAYLRRYGHVPRNAPAMPLLEQER